jgi:membrane protein YqaA with SNARE-associated domain
MPRRSKPLTVAPLIPLLGIAGIFGIDRLHGTPYLAAFVITWALLLGGLFAYVFGKMMGAKRARPGR